MRQCHLHGCGATLALIIVTALSPSAVAQIVLQNAKGSESPPDKSAIYRAARVVMELSAIDVGDISPNISPQSAEFVRWTTTWRVVGGALGTSPRAPLDPATLAQDRSVDSYRLSHWFLMRYVRPQDDPVWCWAASLQSVLRAAGSELTQLEIHERVFPGELPSRATTNDIVDALNRIKIKDRDDKYSFHFVRIPDLQTLTPAETLTPKKWPPGPASPDLTLASIMARRWFLLAGSPKGHLMPVIDMYLDNPPGGPRITELITYDPASNATRHFSRTQVLGMRFIGVRPVAKSSGMFTNRARSPSLIIPNGDQFDLVVQRDGRPITMSTYDDGRQFQRVRTDDVTTVFRAWVRTRGEGWQLIDESGKTLRSVSAPTPFHEGLAAVRLGERWGYIAPDGSMRIEPAFEGAGPFSEDLAPVKLDDRWGFINRKGAVVIPPRFRTARPFADQVAAVSDETGFYFIDREGEAIFDRRFAWAGDFGESLAPVKLPDDVNCESTDRFCFINRQGEIAAEIGTFERARSFKEGLAAIRRDRCWGFITPDGRSVIPAQYSWVGDFSGFIAHVVDHFGRHRYIDRTATPLPISSELVLYLEGIDWGSPDCKVKLTSIPDGATVYFVPRYLWRKEAKESATIFFRNKKLRRQCKPNKSVTNIEECSVSEQYYAIIFLWPSDGSVSDPPRPPDFKVRIVDVRPGKVNDVEVERSAIE